MLVGVLCAALLAVSFAYRAKSGAAKSIVILPDKFQELHLLSGHTYQGSATITNPSETTWELIKITASCSCVNVAVKPVLISPKASSKLTFSVDTLGTTGPKGILLNTRWRSQGTAQPEVSRDIAVRMEVQSLLKLQPDVFNLGKIEWDALGKGVSFDVLRGDANVKWDTIKASSPHLQTWVQPVDGSRFHVAAWPNAEQRRYGFYSERIEVAAVSEQSSVDPHVEISVKAWINPGVNVNPSTIYAGALMQGQSTSGVLTLTKSAKEFRVCSVTSSDPETLRFEPPLIKDASTTLVPYTITGKKQGQHTGLVRVLIALGDEQREFTLPFIAYINPRR